MPRQRPLDWSRNSEERPKLATAEQRAGFPRLGDEYEVLAPASPTYNCIGWSVGDTSAWVWPNQGNQPVHLGDFDALYGFYGFRRVNGLDYSRQPHLDKVVLYALRRPDGGIALTHAALQLRDGSWVPTRDVNVELPDGNVLTVGPAATFMPGSPLRGFDLGAVLDRECRPG